MSRIQWFGPRCWTSFSIRQSLLQHNILPSWEMFRRLRNNYSKPSLKRTNKGDRVSIIADVRYNQVKGYSWKYTIGYITDTHSKHRNTQCDYIKIFTLGFPELLVLKTFLTTKHIKIHNSTQPHFVRYARNPSCSGPLKWGFTVHFTASF
jgi:hypothetical protein